MDTPEKKPRRRWLTCLIVLAILVGTPFLLLFGWIKIIYSLPAPPLVISKETTYVTGPLTADGQVDYFKALEERYYPPEMKTDENGYRIFVRQFGNVGEIADNDFYRLQKYEKLGLDPDIPPTLVLPDEPGEIYEKANNASRERNEVERPDDSVVDPVTPLRSVPGFQDTDIAKGRPWSLEDYPMFADWVSEMDEPLDAIAEAIRKPVFCFPLLQNHASVKSGQPMNLLDMLLPDVQKSRSFARLFQARATYRIAQGDIDGAIEDKLIIHRLGRQIPQNGPIVLIQYLVGLAIEGMAHAIPVGANPEHPLTEQQIHRILVGLDALPPRAPINNAYEGERFTGLSVVPYTGSKRERVLADFGIAIPKWLVQNRYDWNIIYRRMNEMYDAMQEPPPQIKYHEILAAIETKFENCREYPLQKLKVILTPRAAENVIADMLITLIAPTITATEGAVYRLECAENVQRLTFAILLYQSEHGALPNENWVEQIAPYLAGTPAKYFSCPSCPSPEGQTTYALVQYGEPPTVSAFEETMLLVELAEPVPLDKAVISIEEVQEWKRTSTRHNGVMTVGYRSGAVRVERKPEPTTESRQE